MNRYGRLLPSLALLFSMLITLVGCQKLFSEFTIDDSAFLPVPIQIAPSKGLFTTEWGGQARFTIVLDHQPTANVTVALSSSNPSEGTVTPNRVTFTQDDWRAPQVVTVTGVDDSFPDSNQTYKIVTSPATSDDTTFNGKNPLDVELVNIDNETAGVTAVPRDGLVTGEAGARDTFTVVLNSKPDKDVILNLVSDTPTEGTVSPEQLVFTPANWMGPQLVTVTGVDDDVQDQSQKYKINIASTSDDPNYARLPVVSVSVTNLDDESAGLNYALVTGVDPTDPTKLETYERGGTEATFTVALNARPKADVTIDIASDTVTEGTATPESLTFTVDNWNAPQTVTVTGVDDDAADGDQPYLVVLRTRSGDDPDYSALDAVSVPVRNVDDDKPSFTLKLLTSIDPQDSTRLLTTEAGSTATFSLALNSSPSQPVTVKLSSSMESEGTVLPRSLTFTEQNWQAPQVVSVTGVNDDIQDGSPVFFVRSGLAQSGDPGYAGIDPPDVPITNQDDDTANLKLALVKSIDPNNSNQLVTDEYGSTATFTLALTSEPTDDVTIPLTSSNVKEGVISGTAALVFTRQNYRSPQTVTITGQNDAVVDGNQPFSVNIGPTVSNDPNYDRKFVSQVQVTNRDDDQAGVIVNPTSGLVTSEDGKTDSFTIRLQSQPTSKVTIDVSSSNSAEGVPNVDRVVFTPDNWNANQTVVVTGVEDDGTQDGSPTYRIILAPAQSEDPNYKGKPDPPDVTLTNRDNDTANIIVNPTSGLMTGENGLKATFTIRLASKPAGTNVSVRIPLSSSRPLEGSVSPTSVNFDAVNWSSPQTVTVQGLNDDVADGLQTYTIITGPASSTDPNYFNFNASDVSVTNIDDDSANVIIKPVPSTTPAITTEQGGKATFTVVLASLPKADVTYTVTSLDGTEGAVSPGTLKFTTTNGKTAQTVTVTGLNDSVADGDQQYTVRLSNGVSTDADYNNRFGTDLPFSNVDDDIPGLAIDAPTALQTTEYMTGAATFTVALRSQPATGNVNIGVSSSNTKEGTVSPTTLQFTQANWAMPQTVTITGVQDEVADGAQTYQVKLANAASPDPGYSGKFGTQLDVTNVDDDMVGYEVSGQSGTQTSEDGTLAVTFSVKLKSKPAGGSTVTLGMSSGSGIIKEGTVSPSSLLFTTDDWNMAHPVTVTGVDDKKADGSVVYQITFSADAMYGAPAPAPISLTNLDDDVVGVVVNSAVCATSPGTTSTFTVSLTSQPSANVTIALSTDAPTVGAVSPESVTFTPSGTGAWDVAQTVTVTGQPGTAGTMASYNIVTADASAPGETTGYNGYAAIADVMCTNTVP